MPMIKKSRAKVRPREASPETPFVSLETGANA